MKKLLKIVLAGVLAVSMAVVVCACNKTDNTSSQTQQTSATETSTDTKPVILVVSFGTSYNDSREKTIGAVEKAIQTANPDYEVRRAFTSQIIIDKLKERDNLEIDNVEQAFDRLVSDGVKKVVVQPTHLMNGYEYDDLAKATEQYKDNFDALAMGKPLLSSDDDLKKVAEILPKITTNKDDTAYIFMGHGTEHDANGVYTKLQTKLSANTNYFIGTVEATPTLDDVVKMAKDGGYQKVALQPLMVVAGDHANNDMASDEEDSWKSVFEKDGFEVECVLKGLGEFEEIQSIYVDHVKTAIAELK